MVHGKATFVRLVRDRNVVQPLLTIAIHALTRAKNALYEWSCNPRESIDIYYDAFCLAEFSSYVGQRTSAFGNIAYRTAPGFYIFDSARPAESAFWLFSRCFNSESKASFLLFTFRGRIYIYVNPLWICEFNRGNNGKLKSIGFRYRGYTKKMF